MLNTICFISFVTSYITDLPEARDMLSVKWGSSTLSPYHPLLNSRKQVKYCTIKRYRTLKHTLNLIKSLHDGDETVAEQFKALSILSWSAMLSEFAPVQMKPCLDLYAIFRYWPKHALALGSSITIKECTISLQRDSSRTSCECMMQTGLLVFSAIKRQPKPF